MKILKLQLFQQTACYKKPFSFKVAETYPLPPYSTVIGMFHKILNATEYHPMRVSVQGEYESIFSNYQTLRNYKSKEVTTMPRNVHQLYNINLILHVESDDETIDTIYSNIVNGTETFTLGRNEDIVRIDGVKIVQKPEILDEEGICLKYNAYVPVDLFDYGINYKLNSVYTIENNLRKWEKVDVKFVEKGSIVCSDELLIDEDKDVIFFNR